MIKKLIFIAIALLGIGMAIPSTRASIVEKARPVLDGFRARVVPGRLDVMADQLEVRVGRGEGFPSNWPGWLERDYSGIPEDPWGNRYYLQTNRAGFLVGSMGPDGIQATDDDITVSRRLGGR